MIQTTSVPVVVITSGYMDGREQYPVGWPRPKDTEHNQISTAFHTKVRQSKRITPQSVSKWGAVHHTNLHRALTKEQNTPAYLLQYKPTSVKIRLNTGAINWPEAKEVFNEAIEMHLAIFDFDCHSGANIDYWFENLRQNIIDLINDNPGMICYRSRKGAKLVGLLPEPFIINTAEDADAWTRQYEAWCNYISRVYDIRTESGDTPDKLGDWTRLQRIPHDTRKPGGQPERLEVIGDVSQIGYWQPYLEDRDWPAIKAVTGSSYDWPSDTPCLLLELVKQRLLRCQPTPTGPGNFDIECPDAKRHSPNAQGLRDYPGKTSLIVGPIGSILCMSSGCRHRSNNPNSWLDLFDNDEIIEARLTIMHQEDEKERAYRTYQDTLDQMTFDEMLKWLKLQDV